MKNVFLVLVLISVSAFAGAKKYTGKLSSYYCSDDGCNVSVFDKKNRKHYNIFVNDSSDLYTLKNKEKGDSIRGLCHEYDSYTWKDCTVY